MNDAPVLPPDDLACTEEVELITDYLEGALPDDEARAGSSSTSRPAPGLHRVRSSRCAPIAGSLSAILRRRQSPARSAPG